MLFISFLRYIQGYVVFEASGGFPERFINLCTAKKIPLWNIQNKNGLLSANTSSDSLDEVKAVAEKSGMELTVIKVSSLRHTLKKHKSRKGLVIALSLCFFLTVFLSFFIWSVSVEGNDRYTNEEILYAFEKQGVKIGALKGKIDTRQVSENVEEILPDLSWAKVNIRGCFAVIEVRESIKKPVLLDEKTPVNIVSSQDGQIIKYEVSKGEPVLKPGIAVTKGDLLVSGVLTNSDGSERLVHAKAFVTAKVSHIIKTDNRIKLYSLSDERIKYSVFFFGITLPGHNRSENEFESKVYLYNNKKILPAGFFRYRSAEYENEHSLSADSYALLNAFAFNKSAKEVYEKSENVISQKLAFKGEMITGEIICEENIATEKEILLDEK